MVNKKIVLKLISAITMGVIANVMYIPVNYNSVYASSKIEQSEVVQSKDYQHNIPTLRNTFSDYFEVGVGLSEGFIESSDIHHDFLKYQYNAAVAGNFMKPDALQPVEGTFNFTNADKFLKYCEENNMKMRGHTLLWHSQIPQWFFEDPTDPSKPASRELLLSRLKTHIQTVVGRYKGKVDSWDVVNEVLSDSNGLRGDSEGSKWKSIIGDVDGDGYDSDYIEYAFRYAYEADPDTKLIINDYGIEGSNRKRDEMYSLVKRLLEKGVPIDGIGLQMHISMYSPSAQQIKECIENLSQLKTINPDFKIQVTELDMSIYNNSSETTKEVTQNILLQQASQYKKIFDVFKEEAKKDNLDLVVFWGGADDDTWLDNFPVKDRMDAPLLFDRNLQAKPAFWSIVNPKSQDRAYRQKLNIVNTTPVIGTSVDKKWSMTTAFDVDSYVYGTSGSTASVKALWDANNLYILADVNDSTISNKDNVKFLINNGYGEDKVFIVNRNTDTETVKVTSEDNGYKIQAKLPLDNISCAVGNKIGFDIKIDNYDSNGALNSSAVWNDYVDNGKLKSENSGILLFDKSPKLVEAKKGTPSIDGNIDDIWNTANTIKTEVNVQGNIADNADIRTLWDENYLYVLCEVSDSNLDKSSVNAHEQDSVEIFLDENNARASAYDSDDAQYRINYSNDHSGAGAINYDLLKSASKVTSNGYILEAAIPFKNIAKANEIMGVDFQINDAENGQRVGVNSWCDGTGLTWSTMNNIGNILLDDK